MRRLKISALLLCIVHVLASAPAHARPGTGPDPDAPRGNVVGPDGTELPTQYVKSDGEPVSLDTDTMTGEALQRSRDRAGDVQAANEKAKADSQTHTCFDKVNDARLACSTLSALTGLGNTEGAMLEAIIMNQLPNLIGQLASSGKSAAQQCKIQADINKLVTTVSVLKSGACMMMMNSCRSTCRSVAETMQGNYVKAKAATPAIESEVIRWKQAQVDVAAQANKCNSYKTNMVMMLAQSGLGLINTMKSNQCADDLSETALMTPPPLSLTASNVDCSNPSFAATNMACICRSTPSDPMCAQFNAGPGNGAGGAGVVGGSVTTPGLSTEEATDGQVVDPAPEFKGTTGSNTAGSGGGGGGLGAGGGGGLLGGGEGEGGGGSGLDKNVITGTSGSGGGGVAGLTAGSGGGGARGGGSGGGSGGGGSFDFKKYLPKSLFKNRGLAGMTVPSTDGVTGPMGPSLWEKVSNRYQVKKSSLLPEK